MVADSESDDEVVRGLQEIAHPLEGVNDILRRLSH